MKNIILLTHTYLHRQTFVSSVEIASHQQQCGTALVKLFPPLQSIVYKPEDLQVRFTIDIILITCRADNQKCTIQSRRLLLHGLSITI